MGTPGRFCLRAGSERYEFEGGNPEAGQNKAQQKDGAMSDEYAVALLAGSQDIGKKHEGRDCGKGKDKDEPARHRYSDGVCRYATPQGQGRGRGWVSALCADSSLT